MGIKKNKELCQRFLDFAGGDEAMALTTDDFKWWFSGTAPYGGEFNKEELAQVRTLLDGILSNGIKIEVLSMIAEGNQVAVRAESHAVTSGGLDYNNHYHFLFEFRGDKICRLREYNDTEHVKQVLFADLDITP